MNRTIALALVGAIVSAQEDAPTSTKMERTWDKVRDVNYYFKNTW